jgi:hypothetical protein
MRASACLLLLLAFVSAGCGPTVDLAKGLQVDVVSTGWFDLGLVNGQNKLVPSITFTLKNISTETLSVLQVQGVFRRVGENDEWGNAFITAVGSPGLKAGVLTPAIVIRSQLGYTGSEQSRQEMLQNSHFVDARVDLVAKYGSSQWVKLGTYPIARELLTK